MEYMLFPGISTRTQLLFLLVFLTRYVDLFCEFHSLYNTCFKVTYIVVTLATILSIDKFQDVERQLHDSCRFGILIIGATVIAVFVHYNLTIQEVLWAFSEYLEAVAIIPQLFLISKAGGSEKIMVYYIYGLAQYRILYIMSWVDIYLDDGPLDLVSIVPGSIQALIYIDYFFAMFSSLFNFKYQKCNMEDMSIKPVYIITSKELLPFKNPEKPGPMENENFTITDKLSQ
ncbi:hypothetical protein C0J52_23116 [Blattella germanica]|nr:hypothetical protein C0J52_23116 [Blattella germanica]